MFDKSLMNLEVLHQTMLSFKEMFLLNFWKQPLKGVLKTDRKMPVTESIFKNYNFSKEKQTNKQKNSTGSCFIFSFYSNVSIVKY